MTGTAQVRTTQGIHRRSKMNIFVRILLRIVMWSISIFVAPLSRLLTIGTRKKCPPIQNPLLMHSAKTLAHMIRNKQVTSEEVVRSYITRSRDVNKILNAIVEPRYVEAIQEAQFADKLIASEQKTEQELITELPLLGVPITVKESIAVEGMSNDGGRLNHNRIPASEDADVVKLLKEAGAIPILVSNTPDQCMFWETYNKVTGKTNNPYDTRRTPGGSSGGEAALLASGASVLGVASDIAGSLRLPAMFTGIFGHKPSPDTVPIKGHVPESSDKRFNQHFIIGPMVRYAEDLQFALSIMTKPEYKEVLNLDKPVLISDLKFYYMEDDSNSHLSSSVDRHTIQAMRKFILHLQNEYGIKAQRVNIELMKNAYETAVMVLLDIDGIESTFYDEVDPKQTLGVWSEMMRFMTCRSNTIFPVIVYGILKNIVKSMPARTKEALHDNAKLKKEFKDLMGDSGVFLYPTFTGPAHFHYEMYHKLFDISYLTIFNALGLPVTNCPMGFNPDGLPIGMQVAANPNNDRLTIAVAKEIEKVFGGWRPPPSTNEENIDL